MSSIDQQFIEYVVKALVSNPEAVIVERRIDEKGVLLELTVDPEDLGRVIGKRGATAQSLRTLLRALGTKNDARYNLKIVDNGIGGPEDSGDSSDQVGDKRNDSSQSALPPAVSNDDDSNDTSDGDDNDRADQPTPVGSETKPDRQDDDDSRVSKTRRELQELDDLDV